MWPLCLASFTEYNVCMFHQRCWDRKNVGDQTSGPGRGWGCRCRRPHFVSFQFFGHVHFWHTGIKGSPTPCPNALHLSYNDPSTRIIHKLILRGLELQNYFPMSKGLKNTHPASETISSQLGKEHRVPVPPDLVVISVHTCTKRWLNSNAWAIIQNSHSFKSQDLC